MKFKTFFLIFLSMVGVLLIAAVGGYIFLQQKTPSEIFQSPIIQNAIKNQVGVQRKDIIDLVPVFLGFSEPKTYLILFLNNTEMRPGGGFIGSYATVRVSQGKMEVLKVEGTEILDKQTPDTWRPTPPPMIQQQLGLDRWYFRDSNWSPDYVVGAQKALEFYKAEGGIASNEVDAVIGITPAVLESLLILTGPLTIQGINFTAENVVETLEHEVEYGFEDKGIAFENRKQILQPFFHEILYRLGPDAILHTGKYFDLFEKLAQEKHVLVYFLDEKVQQFMNEKKWTGQVPSVSGDFVLWVDANLAALKTDAKIQRTLQYSIAPVAQSTSSTYVATARMKYNHFGVFDKFTSRYRTYARVYVPQGSVLKEVNSVQKNGRKTKITQVDQGIELEKQWFGVFFVIEPQEARELEFIYELPSHIKQQVQGQSYNLLVQKQAGLENIGLTLDLNFGTNIQSAVPPEDQKFWGNSTYTYSTDFRTDKSFKVTF